MLDLNTNNLINIKTMYFKHQLGGIYHRTCNIQIGLMNKANILLYGNDRILNDWINNIALLFDNDRILKHKYCSLIDKINIGYLLRYKRKK